MPSRATIASRRQELVLIGVCTAVGCADATDPSAAEEVSGASASSSDSTTGETTAGETTSVEVTTGAMDTTPTGSTPPTGPVVACDECFPFEQLPPSLQTRAEMLLLAALDQEALYTIASDIKPMSSGFVSLSYPEAEPPAELDELKQIFAAWTCTPELSAGLQMFHQTYEGIAYADGVVFHTPRVAGVVEQFSETFMAIGVAADDPAMAIVNAVDADPTNNRFRGYGHLFGYPAYAVDFFATAEEQEAMTGEFVERDFIHIPTFEADEGYFVYAVPKGHVENEEDVALRASAAPVLARYKQLRAATIGDGKPGVLQLVRTWFDDGDGNCSPRHADLGE